MEVLNANPETAMFARSGRKRREEKSKYFYGANQVENCDHKILRNNFTVKSARKWKRRKGSDRGKVFSSVPSLKPWEKFSFPREFINKRRRDCAFSIILLPFYCFSFPHRRLLVVPAIYVSIISRPLPPTWRFSNPFMIAQKENIVLDET